MTDTQIEEIVFTHETSFAKLIIWDSKQATLSDLYSYARGKGYANIVMQKICDFADDRGLSLILSVSPYGHIEPRLNEEQLTKLYSKFGFVITDDQLWIDMERQPK